MDIWLVENEMIKIENAVYARKIFIAIYVMRLIIYI